MARTSRRPAARPIPLDPNSPTTTAANSADCPTDPTTTTTVPATTVPGQPPTSTVPTTVPGHPTTSTTTAPSTSPPTSSSPGGPTTTTAPTTTTPPTTTTVAPAPPTTAAAPTPTTTIAPPRSTPAEPPAPPPLPSIPMPTPAAAPPPIGAPVAPSVADPVDDPLARVAGVAADRLARWQEALTTLTTTQTEADADDAALVAADAQVTSAQAALDAVPPAPEVLTVGSTPSTSAPSLTDVLPGASSPPVDPNAALRQGRIGELAAAQATRSTAAAVAADAHQRLVEDEVVAEAARLGHDDARRTLADLTAARVPPIEGSTLDAVWAKTDPRRLVVLYTALRQVGDPYIAFTDGPDSFDCSGLTLYAWQAVGVHLVHYSFTQRAQTPAVDAANLQPGDLVFNLRPTGGHVMLSLGVENAIVHAPRTGSLVQISRWRKATGFGSPLAPVVVASPDLAAAPAPSTPSTTIAATTPAGGQGDTVRAIGPLDSPAAPTTLAPPPTWVGGVPEGSRMADDPDAAIFDAAGARYGIDPALLAARMKSVAAEAAAAAAATPEVGPPAPTDAAPPTVATASPATPPAPPTTPAATPTTTSATPGPPTAGVADAATATSEAPSPAGPLALRADLVARLGIDVLNTDASADAAARYLVAAAARLGSLDAALAALDLGAGAVAADGVPAAGPVRSLLDATVAQAAQLRPPPVNPPPPAPAVVYAVAGLPPAEPARVNGSRRKAA